MILNTGDIPNLFQHDEKSEIVERVHPDTFVYL